MARLEGPAGSPDTARRPDIKGCIRNQWRPGRKERHNGLEHGRTGARWPSTVLALSLSAPEENIPPADRGKRLETVRRAQGGSSCHACGSQSVSPTADSVRATSAAAFTVAEVVNRRSRFCAVMPRWAHRVMATACSRYSTLVCYCSTGAPEPPPLVEFETCKVSERSLDHSSSSFSSHWVHGYSLMHPCANPVHISCG